MVFVAAVLAILAICLCAVFLHYRNKNILKGFTEPPGNVFLGHVNLVRNTAEIVGTMSSLFNEYGRTLKVRAGPVMNCLVSCDYKFTEFILNSNTILTKSENYIFLRPWLGNGLIISKGNLWRTHRKIITPAFHFEILKQFVSVFESVGDNLLLKLPEGNQVDLHPIIILCTLDIVCETAMGTKINAQDNKESTYVQAVKRMCKIITYRSLNPIKMYPRTFPLTKDYYVQNKMLKILHQYTTEVLQRKIEDTDGKDCRTTEDDAGVKKKMAFLDLLLNFSHKGKLMSYDDIRDETDTFMFAGHDTTASGISFTLYCLANHPEVQEKALNEQIELFGDEKNPVITYNDLQNMKYLELVIKETLRLYPSVPILGRMTTEDIIYDGKVIPAHTNMAISIFNLHRLPEYFPEPEKFNPERFEAFDGSLPFVYVPFSAGPRNCIGQKFAMLEMKSVVSKVLRNFRLYPATPRHDLKLTIETVLTSANGIKIALRRR